MPKPPRALGLGLLLLLLLSGAVRGENTELPTFSATGGLHSTLEDTVSPAFSATIIIIITVIISGSAYLCFLKYICTGCCKSTQVVPVRRLDRSRSEEQV
ncbi:Adhesion G protein-coupled receptor E1 [Varanus komodoensis]|nr:Adhesion G protein-coupled receptor E1 [Varanus komodoensis]